MTSFSADSREFPGLPVGQPSRARRLRVCIASCEFIGPIRNGGIGTAYTAMAHALNAAGHDVTLFYTQGKGCENETVDHWKAFYRKHGLKFVARPSDPDLRIDAPHHALRSYETYRWLKQQDFDVVHFPEWGGDGYYSLLAKHQGLAFQQTLFCIGTHSPTTWIKEANSEHFSQPREIELDFMERRCIELADYVVSPCDYMLQWMRSRGFNLPAHSFVQQNILPISARAKASTAQNAVSDLVFFGRLETRKGIELFCDALDIVARDSAPRHLRITFLGKAATVNGTASRAYIAKRAKNWPWKFEAICDKDQAGAMKYLQQPGRLAVMPSFLENSPYTVLECLGSGIPFLASRVGGIPELIAPEHLERATFEPNARALAQLLEETLQRPVTTWQPAVDADENERRWVQWHATLADKCNSAGTLSQTTSSVKPRVSVCIAHYNRPQFLKQALASMEAQDYSNFEVLVVDDGSNKPEVLEELERLEPWLAQRNWRLIRQENRYLSAARNTGARHATGDYLLFMDDDNYARPNELSTFISVAVRTGADVVTSCMDYFEGTTAPKLKSVTRWVPLGGAPSAGYFRNCFGDANCLVKRSVFAQLGGFTEIHGVTHEDWEFLAKATIRGFKLEMIPEGLFYYRYTPNSMIRSTSQYRNHMRHIRAYLDVIPQSLHQVLLVAQGAWIEQVRQGNMNQLTLKWRSQFEAGLSLIKAGKTDAAVETLCVAVKTAEETKHPGVILSALLDVGKVLCPISAKRAREVLLIAIQLGETAKHPEAVRLATELLAELGPDSAPAVPAPRQAAPVVSGPRVSIIIPVFNKLDLTRTCLDSIAKVGSIVPFEVVVVNNASTDGTTEFLTKQQAESRIRVVQNSRNEGFAHACNQGAQVARGPLLLFLNNDTQVTPGWLDALTEAASRPNVGIAGARLLYPDGRIQHAGIGFINGVPDHPHRFASANAPEVNHFRELDMVTGACLAIHRELYTALAGFDETFRNGVEDVDLCLRARAAGYKVVYEPKACVFHMEGQSAGRFDHVKQNLTLFFQRWGTQFDHDFKFVQPSPARTVVSQKSFLLGESPREAIAPVSVAWDGSFLDFGSLSHVNRELTGQLERRSSIRLNRVCSQTEAPAAFSAMAKTLSRAAKADDAITVRHAWPPNWKRSGTGKLVIMQPWEFGSLPKDWVDQASHVDEFWAYTNYVRQCYLDSGIDAAKVKVVPLGIDPERFRPDAAPRPLATRKKFKFLFVGGTIGRKGPDVLLSAFLKSFTAADDVCLVIKDFGGKSVYRGQTFAEKIKAVQQAPNAPEILHIDEELSPEELPGLYTACHCLVHPYRGEGFGLPVLEAMACGLPVIVTKGGSTDDFATDEFAYRIPSTRRGIGRQVGEFATVGEAWLLEPDLDAVVDRLRWMAGNPEEARIKGLRASEHARHHWTWKRSAEAAAARLQALASSTHLVQTAAPALRAARELPLASKLGSLNKSKEAFGRKQTSAAWTAAVEAIHERPFHPEAHLLLADIASATGNGNLAREVSQWVRQMAPGWKLARNWKPGYANGKSANTSPLPDLTFKPELRNRVSVCVITRNEESLIERCLRSVKAIAQQIVVVDTGSTDRTVEIAKSLGAEVHTFAWCDDFSAARNAALEHARGDWVLMLDADEELPADQHTNLKKDLARKDVIAYRMPLTNVGKEDGCSYVPRLFRNVPGAHFHGRIHEQVFPSLIPMCKEWGMKTDLGTAQILHHGYTKEMIRDRNKIERNLRLLELAVAEQPGDINLVMNLGLELTRSERIEEGLERYRQAFQKMSDQSPGDVVPELREVLLTQYASHLCKNRKFSDAIAVLNSPLAQNPGLTGTQHFTCGLSHYELKQHPEAAKHFRSCIEKRMKPALSPINVEIRTAAPQHLLALCLAELGDVPAADKAFQAALVEPGKSELIKLDYARFLAKQQRPVDALHKLHELVGTNSQNVAAWKLGAEIALGHPEFLEFACDWTSEAIRALPVELAIVSQRAEALLLNQQTNDARALWEKACNCARPPQALAALILCSAVEAQPVPSTRDAAEELATSKAFVGWYQKLISAGAEQTIVRLNSRIGDLRSSLPTAANLLESAITSANA